MEFSVKKFDLLEEISMMQGVVERKTTIPILSNALFEAKGGRLTITATDLDLSIRASCEAKVKKEGSGTIPAKKLMELVRLLPDDEEIRFRLLENHWMQIICDRKTYKLVGMSRENFPNQPGFPESVVKIPAQLLFSLIAKTSFAISAEESRYTLNGALFLLKPEMLLMVATDGHRLALVEADHKISGLRTELKVLIPRKAMAEIQRLIGDADKDALVEFAEDDSHIFFQFDGRRLISRKLTGQFPNYEAVLPRGTDKSVILGRDEFQNALRRVSQLADQRSHAVKLMLTKEGVELSSSSPEYGEAKEAIEKEFKGDPVSIGFNAQYILDFLAAAAEGDISIELKDEQSAGQMRPLGDKSVRYRYVVMPMRI